MNDIYKRALVYVRNANRGATLADFLDDHAPVGEVLWADLSGLIGEDDNGFLFLTREGEAALAEAEKTATTMHAWFSEKQSKLAGSAVYARPDDSEVECTEVSQSKSPSSRWDDMECRGEVTRYVRRAARSNLAYLVKLLGG